MTPRLGAAFVVVAAAAVAVAAAAAAAALPPGALVATVSINTCDAVELAVNGTCLRPDGQPHVYCRAADDECSVGQRVVTALALDSVGGGCQRYTWTWRCAVSYRLPCGVAWCDPVGACVAPNLCACPVNMTGDATLGDCHCGVGFYNNGTACLVVEGACDGDQIVGGNESGGGCNDVWKWVAVGLIASILFSMVYTLVSTIILQRTNARAAAQAAAAAAAQGATQEPAATERRAGVGNPTYGMHYNPLYGGGSVFYDHALDDRGSRFYERGSGTEDWWTPSGYSHLDATATRPPEPSLAYSTLDRPAETEA